MQGIIKVTGIKIYAYHGCLSEESHIGGNYIVDVIITAELKEAIHSDNISRTVDYGDVYNIVKKQMGIRSNLIEHVAKRIADELLKLPKTEKAEVTVTKINPPLNGNVESVSAVITVSN
jgi:dihydroneopterin aldolase